MKTIEIRIDGMNCPGCARSVRSALDELAGVEPEQVTIGSARVRYDEGQATPEGIVQRLERAGFPAQVAKEGA